MSPRNEDPVAAAEEAPVPPPPVFDLHPEWSTNTALAFERALEVWLPEGRAVRLTAASLAMLSAALERSDPIAVRAAVLLARSRDPDAGEVLLARLEQRITHGASPNRAFDPETEDAASRRPAPFSADAGPDLDASDVVAAAAFADWTLAMDAAQRLQALAIGPHPHPDLEVRVECARSALALGRDAVIPFLVRILREGTSQATSAPDYDRTQAFDWVQMRAAEALSARAGVACRFRTQASVKWREQEALRLEKLLVPAEPKKKKR